MCLEMESERNDWVEGLLVCDVYCELVDFCVIVLLVWWL